MEMSTALPSTSQDNLRHTKRRGLDVWLRPQNRRTHRIRLSIPQLVVSFSALVDAL